MNENPTDFGLARVDRPVRPSFPEMSEKVAAEARRVYVDQPQAERDEEDLAEAEARGCTLQEWREIKYCPE